MGQAILVAGIGVGDVGLGFLEFGLAEFDDGAETEMVARLRKVEGEAGLFAQLLGDGKSLVGAGDVLPGSAHIARDIVSEVGKLLTIDLGLEIGGFGASVEEKSVEDRDVDIYADGAVPIRDVVVPNGNFADNAEGADGGALQIVLGAAEFLRGLDLVLERENFRVLLQSLLNQRADIHSGSGDGGLFLDNPEILLIRIAENRGKGGKQSLVIVARFEQQELSTCHEVGPYLKIKRVQCRRPESRPDEGRVNSP